MLNVVLFLHWQLHFVSYNTKYADIVDALNHEDGLAVLGLFIQVTRIKRLFDAKVRVKRRTSHEPNPIQAIKLMWSSAFDPIKFD